MDAVAAEAVDAAVRTAKSASVAVAAAVMGKAIALDSVVRTKALK